MKLKTLYKKLHTFAPKFYGEKSMGQMMYWVRKMLKPYNVKVNRIIDKQNKAISGFTIGGFYDPSHEFGEQDIEMYLIFNYVDVDKKFFLEEWNTKVLIDELFTTLAHEKRHRYQFKCRGFNYGAPYKMKGTIDDEELASEIAYYGDPDEVDAYAQEAVIENRLGREETTMAKYRELFDKHDKKVYNRFLKKYYRFDQRVSL
jgi:hypothetical protein